MTVAGLISDTHSLLRPEALAALAGCTVILHAGDIGKPEVIAELENLVPVYAIRGNNDRGDWADAYPEERRVDIEGWAVHLIHSAADLSFVPQAEGIDVVASGHSHRHETRDVDGVLFVNPGSAGPRRFKLPVTVARLSFGRDGIEAEIVQLKV